MNKIIIIGSLALVGVLLFIVGIISLNSKEELTMVKESSIENLYPVDEITHSHGIAVDSFDESKVYIATHEGLFLLKNDKDLYRIGDSEDDFMSFELDQNQNGIVYASGHPVNGGNLGLQKSEDSGVTWKKISDVDTSPVDFHALTVGKIYPQDIFGYYQGNLYISDTSGESWQKAPVNFLISSLESDPEDENVIYATTPQGQGVMKTTDKGNTWAALSDELTSGIVSAFAVNPIDSEQMIVYSESLGGLAISSDGGQSWNKVGENTSINNVTFISYSKQNPTNVYLITYENSIYKSADGGENWKFIR